MTQLIHGGDIYSASKETGINQTDFIDFSANINPLGIPYAVKEAMVRSLDGCINYPDPLCRDLVQAIADHEEVEASAVLCGNGAADLIYRLARAHKPKKALLLAPTFAEYELALQTVGCTCEYFVITEKNGFIVTEDYLERLTSDVDLIVLCNPNNPTGTLIPEILMEQILARCNTMQITCLLDECFNDFLENGEAVSQVGQLRCYPNLIILKAFTKLYGLAGVRLGYALSYKYSLLEAMRLEGQCWNVSVIAQAAGKAALAQEAFRKETLKLIAKERQYLMQELGRLGMTVFDSAANYVFFKCSHGVMIQQMLRQQGILIRSCNNYHGLDDQYFRIAVKSHEENQILIQALERM
ncbi:MAG: threonine-phosphate decarboxylase CobD [Cellulosilyticaceae bacterium]